MLLMSVNAAKKGRGRASVRPSIPRLCPGHLVCQAAVTHHAKATLGRGSKVKRVHHAFVRSRTVSSVNDALSRTPQARTLALLRVAPSIPDQYFCLPLT